MTADILGTVTDNSGAVIPNATVTVKNLDTNLTRTQHTDAIRSVLLYAIAPRELHCDGGGCGFKIFTAPQVDAGCR